MDNYGDELEYIIFTNDGGLARPDEVLPDGTPVSLTNVDNKPTTAPDKK